MAIQKQNTAAAFTLIETTVAMVILAIASVAALSYQAYAAKQGLLARSEMTATRTARLLLEDWKSTGGSEYYEPADLELGFVPVSQQEVDLTDIPGSEGALQAIQDMSGLQSQSDRYLIEIDDIEMIFLLNYEDVETDETAQTTLRRISVTAIWTTNQNRRSEDGGNNGRGRGGEDGDGDDEDGDNERSRGNGSSESYSGDQILNFTTYVRLDASGG